MPRSLMATSAAHDPQQHGFRLIVLGVGCGHNVSATCLANLVEEQLPRPTGRHFERQTRSTRCRRDINARSDERHAKTVAECTTKRLVGVGVRAPDAVMKVERGVENQVSGFVQLSQQHQQRHRRAAPQRTDDPRIWTPQRVARGEGS